MAKVARSKVAPKGAQHRLELNLTKGGLDRDEVLDWCRDQLSRPVYWDVVRFRPENIRNMPTAKSRQLYFEEDEDVLIVWFTLKRDAAMFKITWAWR